MCGIWLSLVCWFLSRSSHSCVCLYSWLVWAVLFHPILLCCGTPGIYHLASLQRRLLQQVRRSNVCHTLTMYNYGTTIISSVSSPTAFSLQNFLVFVPLIYISVVVIRHLYRRIRDKLAERKRRRQTVIIDPEQEGLVSNNEGPLTMSGSHDYLSFMKETGRMEDMNTYRPTKSWQKPGPNSTSSSKSTSPGVSNDDNEKI